MSEIILYPTETVYALGVNPFDRQAWHDLCELKGRRGDQTASWLVPAVSDISFYADVTPEAQKLMDQYMPGPLTIVLRANGHIPRALQALDGTVSFRVTTDPVAQQLIEDYMVTHNVPLTCTSANVHGKPTMGTPQRIAQQFGDKVQMISTIIDGGPRFGQPSTIIRCIGDQVTVLRQGSIRVKSRETTVSFRSNQVSAARS